MSEPTNPPGPHRFQKGNKAASRRPKEWLSEEQFEAGAQLYRDMVHVYTRPKDEDKTPGHFSCRDWLKDNKAQFMAKFADLEKSIAAGKAEAAKKEAAGPMKDEQSENVERLIEELLEKMKPENP